MHNSPYIIAATQFPPMDGSHPMSRGRPRSRPVLLNDGWRHAGEQAGSTQRPGLGLTKMTGQTAPGKWTGQDQTVGENSCQYLVMHNIYSP